MNRRSVFHSVAWLAMAAYSLSAAAPRAAGQTVNLERIGDLNFSLAPGLTIEPATAPELVKWPMMADWDSQGRLVVVESAGVARPIEEHNKQLLHRVVRLVDDDGDGRFDRRIVAADKLPFPEGVLCLGNKLLVAAPPAIWELTDNDGDGVCEERQIWHDGETLTGCANDLHGPYLGRDGWIYWCKGAFAEQSRETSDGTWLKDSAAHVYRRRLEGGPVEAVMSGGMDNPVEVAITPEGERFFTSTFLQHPGNGLRDGIAHAVYGGVYGKDHGVIRGLPRTGPLMPIMTQLGPAAPSGLMYLEQNRLLPMDRSLLPKRYLVATLFNLQKVTAHRLLPAGSSYTTQDIDLVRADRIDFHPTDVIEDADASLLIVDTGGWYDLCCPTSRVDQQTAAGGIYRLRPRKAVPRTTPAATPVWSDVSIEQLVELIHDGRPWVSRMALLTLRERGDERAVRLLSEQVTDESRLLERRLAALWGLSWIGSDAALESLARLLDESHPHVQHAACQAIAAHRLVAARSRLEALLVSGEPSVQRAAAEALGRIGNASSIAPLMALTARLEREGGKGDTADLAQANSDRILSHSCQYAILEINHPAQLEAYLAADDLQQRLVAMQLLEQLRPGELAAEVILRAVQQGEPAERAFALNLLQDRSELAGQVLPLLDVQLRQALPSEAGQGGGAHPGPELSEWTGLLAAWRDQESVQQFVTERLAACLGELVNGEHVQEVDQTQLAQGLALAEAWRNSELPASMLPVVERLVMSEPQAVMPWLAKFDLAGEATQPLVAAMQTMIGRCQDPVTQRQWLASLPAVQGYRDDGLVSQLAEALVQGEATVVKETGELLRRFQLTSAAAETILNGLEHCAAPELMRGMELVSSLGNAELDQRLLDRLAQLPTARALPQNFVVNLYRSKNASLLQQARKVEEQLVAPNDDVASVVAATLKTLPAGDAVKGLEVYRGSQAACSACHQMGYVGGQIGPELTRIGQSRTPEALLEAILFPSSRIEQSYQSWQVLTADGQVYNGLMIREEGQQIELQLAADRRVTLQRTDIEEMRPSQVSIMPTGMSEILSPQQLADLLALLQAAR